jgi:macrodomain Ter protein organizer (MatP/YcbG family)
LFIGLPDAPVHYGDYKYLLKKYGLTGEQIARTILAACEDRAVDALNEQVMVD